MIVVLGSATSKNSIPIRLTQERWYHITTSHKEINPDGFSSILDVVVDPDLILKGDVGELLAVKRGLDERWLVVAYKENSATDGFIITAYLTTDSRWLFQRETLWNKV